MVEQIKSVQVMIRLGQVRTCQIRSVQIHVKSDQCQVRSGLVRPGQDRTDQSQIKVKSDQGQDRVNVKTFQVRLCQIRSRTRLVR